jgi:hypothetical protein
MIRFLFSLLAFSALSFQAVSAQSFQWAYAEEVVPRTYCSEYGTSHASVAERLIDPDGNILRTGTFEGTLDFDPGAGEFLMTNPNPDGSSAFIQKIDPDGNLIWAKSLGAANNSRADHVRIDESGNIFIAGIFKDSLDADPSGDEFVLHAVNEHNQIFVLKLDSDGNFIWAKKLDGLGASMASMEVNYEGELVFVGQFLDTIDCDPGPAEMYLGGEVPDEVYLRRFIATWDNDGDLIWANLLDKQEGLHLERDGCDLDESGNIYLAGTFSEPYDFDPGPAVFVIDSSYRTRGYVRKLDPEGNFIWAKIFNGDEDIWPGPFSRVFSIHVESEDNITLGGFFSGYVDFDLGPDEDWFGPASGFDDGFVMRIDGDGNTQWYYTFGGLGDERVDGVTVNELGNTLIIGDYTQLCDFNDSEDEAFYLEVDTISNTAIIELNADGEFLWAKAVGSNDCVGSTEILSGPGGAIYAAGVFKGTADLNPNLDVLEFTAAEGVYAPYLIKLGHCEVLPIAEPEVVNNCAEPYFWPQSGLVYNSTGIYETAIENYEGCDSIVQLDLKITDLTVVNDELTLMAMEDDAEYQWLDCDDDYAPIIGETDQNFTAETPGNYAVVITVDDCADTSDCICVDFASYSEIFVTECVSYTTPSFDYTYYESGVYTDTIMSEVSCGDSIITINLTIGEILASITATEDETFLVSDIGDAEYQWVDCDNDFEPIPGETDQHYIVTSMGSYAVIVNLFDCVDTSDCYNYFYFSTPENANEQLKLFPNPTAGELHILLNQIEPKTQLIIWSPTGQQVAEYSFENEKELRVDFDAAPGLYIAEVKITNAASVFLQFVNK